MDSRPSRTDGDSTKMRSALAGWTLEDWFWVLVLASFDVGVLQTVAALVPGFQVVLFGGPSRLSIPFSAPFAVACFAVALASTRWAMDLFPRNAQRSFLRRAAYRISVNLVAMVGMATVIGLFDFKLEISVPYHRVRQHLDLGHAIEEKWRILYWAYASALGVSVTAFTALFLYLAWRRRRRSSQPTGRGGAEREDIEKC